MLLCTVNNEFNGSNNRVGRLTRASSSSLALRSRANGIPASLRATTFKPLHYAVLINN